MDEQVDEAPVIENTGYNIAGNRAVDEGRDGRVSSPLERGMWRSVTTSS